MVHDENLRYIIVSPILKLNQFGCFLPTISRTISKRKSPVKKHHCPEFFSSLLIAIEIRKRVQKNLQNSLIKVIRKITILNLNFVQVFILIFVT